MTFTARDKNPTVNKYWTYQQVFNRQVEADLIDIETELASISGGGGSGANTGLSNLTTTSINQNLIPQSSKTLGDSSNRWSGLWSTTGNFSGDLTVDTNVFFVDTTNNRVGINNASPSVALDVTGALKISGDATFDTSTFYIDSTNNVVISGSSTSDTGARIASVVDGGGSSALQCFRAISYQSTSTSSTASFYGRRAKGTASSPANVTADTPLSGFYAGGYYDAGGGVNGWTNAVGTIRIISAEAYTSSTSHSSYIEFATTASGATSRTIRGYIDSDGSWTIGTVRGNSSGTPGTLYAGIGVFTGNLTVDSTTFFVDSTNNRVGVLTTSTISVAHLTVGNGGAVATNSIIAINGGSTGQAALYLYQNSVLKGIVGSASGTNSLITGTAVNDLAIRNTQGILFSTDNGVTAHFIINSSGNIALGNSFITGMRANVGNGGAGSGNEIIAINGSATGITATYYYQNGTVKGLFGLAGASNNLINGSVQGDFNIRNSQAILFSADGGTTNHAKLLSTGDFWVKTNVLYVSAVNSRVGINNASPSVALDVTGAYNQSFAGTTTNGFNITGDSVTTGTLARIISNASNTSARSILSVIQDHASATSAIAVSIQQDSSSNALFLDHNLAGSTIEIDADDNSATAMYGLRMNIANAGAGLEYAFRFDGSEIVSSAVGGSQDKKVRVSIAGTDYFVPLYTA